MSKFFSSGYAGVWLGFYEESYVMIDLAGLGNAQIFGLLRIIISVGKFLKDSNISEGDNSCLISVYTHRRILISFTVSF